MFVLFKAVICDVLSDEVSVIIAYPFLSEYKDDVLMPSELTQPIVRLANSLFK